MICPTIPLLAASVGLYQLTDLGSVTFPHSLANDINANGLIVGQALQEAPGLESRAVVWSEGVPTDMGTLGGTQSTALRVNDANQVVGWSYVNADAYYRGFIWSDGAVTELGTLGGASSGASGINQTGEVVGWSFLSDEWTTHGFVWRGGPLEDLGRLSTDYRNTMAFDLNDSGRVVGYAYKLMPQYASKAVLWDDGAIAELDDLGGTQALAYSVNTAGTIVGWSNLPGDDSAHATLWTDGEGVVDLGVLGGNYTNSSAVAIAANGTVVGASSDPDVAEDSRAVIWVDREIEDLNELVSNGEGWLLTAAYGVAENGAIVGLATTAGDLVHAVLLTPPCDLSLDLFGQPETVSRGGSFGFTAKAMNSCEAALEFDEAVIVITANWGDLTRILYSGAPLSVAPGSSLSAPIFLSVPPIAPLGTYDVEITIARDGVDIVSDAFTIEVTE